MYLDFGNPEPIAGRDKDGNPVPQPPTEADGHARVARVTIPDMVPDWVDGEPIDRPITVREALHAVERIWPHASTAAPTWVQASEDCPAGFVDVVAAYVGCPVGAPDDVEATHHTRNGPPSFGPDGPMSVAS